MRSIAPYDLMVAVLRGDTPTESVAAHAFAASAEFWQRALTLEACAVQFDRALRGSIMGSRAPLPLRRLLSDATAHAVRQAFSVPGQMAELATAARELGIRVLLLKGAGRLLRGAIPGTRSMCDIDVLAAPADAGRLHELLKKRLGYKAVPTSPEHHLPTLMRAGVLPVEVHIQLGPRPTDLDTRIWHDAHAAIGGDLFVPSATSMLLHVLEHGALVHWAVRYRLRDLVDVAEAWDAGVDCQEVEAYLRRSSHRAVLATLLGGARRFTRGLAVGRRSAWRTIRRVAHVRHLVAAHISDGQRAESLCIAGGVLAEGSPRALLRPAQLALFGVKQARLDPAVLQLGQSSTS